MDLDVVGLFLLELLLLSSPLFLESKALQFPTSSYFRSFNAKDAKEAKEDAIRRRQARRQEPISLKPPPQDWPELSLGVADFIVADKPPATSVSPLTAYQAKLEKELIEQTRQAAQDMKRNTPEKSEESVWTSSEEDFKKLLDPDELLKHNKQLRPFVNQARKKKTIGKKTKSTDQQDKKKTKPASVTSPTVLKVKTALRKAKRKSKTAGPKVTKNVPRSRGKKGKGIQKEHTSVTESTERKFKTKSVETAMPKTKKRTNIPRKFAFAVDHFKESENESTTPKSKLRRTTKLKPTISEELTTIKSKGRDKVTKKPKKTVQSTFKTTTVGTTAETETEITVTSETVNYKPAIDPPSSRTIDNSCGTLNNGSSVPKAKTLPVKTATETLSTDKRHEIRDKRKQMKQEMVSVIKTEQLDGSFGDKDSDWTTSEKKKIPISNVTSRQLLMGILKQKIVSFIDKVLKGSPKLKEEQQRFYEEKILKWNITQKTHL